MGCLRNIGLMMQILFFSLFHDQAVIKDDLDSILKDVDVESTRKSNSWVLLKTTTHMYDSSSYFLNSTTTFMRY